MASTTKANGAPPEEATLSTADNAAAGADGTTPSDGSKLRTFLSILKRFIGVSDMAAVRFSLPAQLLEPIPNLEYWHYLDRPETFAAIGDSDDELERMIAVLRFWFTKDLKYAKGKPCKPYNSALGEFFRCSWVVGDEGKEGGEKSAITTETTTPSQPAAGAAAASTDAAASPLQVNYLTEQTSHHPPISAFIYDCPAKGITAVGYDQLSAKFTGTSVKVTAGQFNRGIFITLHQRDNEEYQLTHPAAYLGGFLRGNLSVTVADTCYITCPQTGLKTILHYLEEGYFGKTQNRVEGLIYKPADLATDNITRLRDVPRDRILARIDGCWTDQVDIIRGASASLPDAKKAASADRSLLMDVRPLFPVPKRCPPESAQLPNESRKFWDPVTKAILSKQFALATQQKTQLEERQRARAAERAAKGKEWTPRFFKVAVEEDGRARVNEEGEKALEGLQRGEFGLVEPEEYAAL